MGATLPETSRKAQGTRWRKHWPGNRKFSLEEQSLSLLSSENLGWDRAGGFIGHILGMPHMLCSQQDPVGRNQMAWTVPGWPMEPVLCSSTTQGLAAHLSLKMTIQCRQNILIESWMSTFGALKCKRNGAKIRNNRILKTRYLHFEFKKSCVSSYPCTLLASHSPCC